MPRHADRPGSGAVDRRPLPAILSIRFTERRRAVCPNPFAVLNFPRMILFMRLHKVLDVQQLRACSMPRSNLDPRGSNCCAPDRPRNEAEYVTAALSPGLYWRSSPSGAPGRRVERCRAGGVKRNPAKRLAAGSCRSRNRWQRSASLLAGEQTMVKSYEARPASRFSNPVAVSGVPSHEYANARLRGRPPPPAPTPSEGDSPPWRFN